MSQRSRERFTIPKTPTTEPKCIRFPLDVVEAIENEVQKGNSTFSAFVIEACKYALKNLDN